MPPSSAAWLDRAPQVCRGCRRPFRLHANVLKEHDGRETVENFLDSCDFCSECVTGEPLPGEHITMMVEPAT
jgi:hypothetical protein